MSSPGMGLTSLSAVLVAAAASLGSPLPTRAPSRSPVSPGPTISPTTAFPTTSPSQAPTLKSQKFVLALEFEFDALDRLKGPTTIVWEEMTADHINNRLRLLDMGIQWPTVSTRIRRQSVGSGGDDNGLGPEYAQPPDEPLRTTSGKSSGNASSASTNKSLSGRADGEGGNRRRLGSSAWLRRLQSMGNAGPNRLVITSVSIVSFKSAEEYATSELAEMVGEAFNSEEDRALYIKSLKDTKEESFLGISSVVVKINGDYVPEDPNSQPTPSGGGGSNEDEKGVFANFFEAIPWIYAGPAAGAILLLFIVAVCVCVRQNARKKAFMANAYGTKVSKTIIDVDNGDDVSTLGDPVFSSRTMLASGDRTIVSTDYEYARQYGRNDAPTAASPKSYEADRSITSGSRITMATAANGIRKMDASLFSDDASFEKQYCDQEQNIEVHAPAGKLGVVIDTPVGGFTPVVHAIKDSSVLADKVRVGDQLLSVDDIDVTLFSSVEVSRLISSRAHQPSRVLLFLRQVVVHD